MPFDEIIYVNKLMNNTNRFAEIPFYALFEYFTALGKYYTNPKDDISSVNLDRFSNVVFYKDSFIDWTGFLDWNGDYQRSHTYSSISECRVVRPGHHIIINGGQWTDLFVKKESYGYREVRVRPKWWDKEWINSNWFLFDLVESDITKPGVWKQLIDLWLENRGEEERPAYLEVNDKEYSLIADIETNGPVEVDILPQQEYDYFTVSNVDIAKSAEGKSYAFKNYVKSNLTLSSEAELEPNDTFYFRKDSFFFEWFEKNLAHLGSTITESQYDKWDHANFINPNVLFTYFGIGQTIHGDKNSWQIQHYSMKNFMINALPPNDLGPKNYTALWETYDRVYEETYNMERNITRLLDPEEVQSAYLNYQALYYDVALGYSLTDLQRREFIRNLPTLLKKKGTQSSLAVIWRTLIGSANTVSFYERWHEERVKKSLGLASFSAGIGLEPIPEYEGTIAHKGSLPNVELGSDFQNPLNLVDYAVLYCYGEPGNLHATLFLYWERERIYKITFDKTYPLEGWKTQTSRFTQLLAPWIYFIGLEQTQFEVTKGQSADIIEDGIVVEYSLDRREAKEEELDTPVTDKTLPADNVSRFFAHENKLVPYNTPNMVELTEFFPLMGNYYGKITLEGNAVTVDAFWDSGSIPNLTRTETIDWLDFNLIRNYCYKNYFGFGGYSYKFDRMVKSEGESNRITSYWTIKRIPIDFNLINWFQEPNWSTTELHSVNTIMYNFDEPKYFVKLVINLDNLPESFLQIYWNNECLLTTKCPKDARTFAEIKVWGQNYIADVSTKNVSGIFFAWPKFGDRLDDTIGAEMDSNKQGSIYTFWYKIKVKNLKLK